MIIDGKNYSEFMNSHFEVITYPSLLLFFLNGLGFAKMKLKFINRLVASLYFGIFVSLFFYSQLTLYEISIEKGDQILYGTFYFGIVLGLISFAFTMPLRLLKPFRRSIVKAQLVIGISFFGSFILSIGLNFLIGKKYLSIISDDEFVSKENVFVIPFVRQIYPQKHLSFIIWFQMLFITVFFGFFNYVKACDYFKYHRSEIKEIFL